MRLLGIAAAAVGVAAGTMTLAQSTARGAESPSAAPAETWRATCGYCHGGPMRAPELRGLKLPEAVVINTVRQGAAGMPPFHQSAIPDAELRALVRWIAAQPTPKPQP